LIWFTSDTHFGHKNIIRYCNRPFKNVWEMNYQLIENWNARVKSGDTVYHLGDFAFLAPKQIKDVIDCLNGNIIMVRGNHDGPNHFYPGIAITLDLKIDPNQSNDYWLPLSHYPEIALKACDGMAFCGHIHNQWRSWQPTPNKLIYNVGVDVWDYRPISMDEIQADMNNPVDRVVGEWKDSYHGSS
jgi:calcineurin-like phosphoesterase family protein